MDSEGPASPGGVKVQHQGKAVAERDGTGYLVMFPNGSVESSATKGRAEAAIKRWFSDNLPTQTIGVGEIEWRS